MFDDRAGDPRPRPGRGPQQAAARARGPGRSGSSGRRRARGARRGARAVPRGDAARGRAHALRHHRARAARGGDRAAAALRPRARLRRLPRPRPLRPQAQQREQGPRRVGDRARARRRGGAARCTWPPSTAPATGPCGASASRRCSTRTSPARSCAARNLQPEDCFGLTRLLHVRAHRHRRRRSPGARTSTACSSSAAPPLAAAQRALLAEAPLALAAAPPFHAEVLDWEAVAAWVAPCRHTAPRTPSPLPHLPSSWEELTDRLPGGRRRPQRGLLRRADHPRRTKSDLADLSLASFRSERRAAATSSSTPPSCVVIAYRDRAEYE